MNALGYTILHADGCETLGQFQDFPTDATAICEAIKRLFAMIGEDAQFERVSVWYKGGYTDMFVNQTGRLKGLRRNEAATAICRASVLTPPETATTGRRFVVDRGRHGAAFEKGRELTAG